MNACKRKTHYKAYLCVYGACEGHEWTLTNLFPPPFRRYFFPGSHSCDQTSAGTAGEAPLCQARASVRVIRNDKGSSKYINLALDSISSSCTFLTLTPRLAVQLQ